MGVHKVKKKTTKFRLVCTFNVYMNHQGVLVKKKQQQQYKTGSSSVVTVRNGHNLRFSWASRWHDAGTAVPLWEAKVEIPWHNQTIAMLEMQRGGAINLRVGCGSVVPTCHLQSPGFEPNTTHTKALSILPSHRKDTRNVISRLRGKPACMASYYINKSRSIRYTVILCPSNAYYYERIRRIQNAKFEKEAHACAFSVLK